MTVVFFSDIPWESLHQRPQHLALRLGRRARVLWVEPVTLGRRPIFTPEEKAPGVFGVTLPAFPLNARDRWIRALAVGMSKVHTVRAILAKIQRVLLTRALRRLQSRESAITCLVQNFQFMHLTEVLHPKCVVFDYIDDAFGFTTFPDFVRSEWLLALHRADSITVTSSTLRRRILEVCEREVKLVPNGVEFDRFAHPAATSRPADLPSCNQPIIGYIGSIYPWIDFQLLDQTIELMRDVQFVMIGHLHPDVASGMNRLQRHKNFCYLGRKPYAEVPAYVNSFDVGIIPFKRTLLTEAVNPVKLYEYSAAGIPTVVTDFSDDTISFGDLILIARSVEEFARLIRDGVRRRSDSTFTGRLRSFAEKNDWDTRAQDISDLLQLNGS